MSAKKKTNTITETLSYLPKDSRPQLVRSSLEASESLTISLPPSPPPPPPPPPQLTYDIEHVPVKNDPRTWSPLRKVGSLFAFEI